MGLDVGDSGVVAAADTPAPRPWDRCAAATDEACWSGPPSQPRPQPDSDATTSRRCPSTAPIWDATCAWGIPASTLRTINSRPAGVNLALACDIEPCVCRQHHARTGGSTHHALDVQIVTFRLERAQIGEIQPQDALGLQALCAWATAYLRGLLAVNLVCLAGVSFEDLVAQRVGVEAWFLCLDSNEVMGLFAFEGGVRSARVRG